LFGFVLIELFVCLSESFYLLLRSYFDPRLCVVLAGVVVILLYFGAIHFNKTSVEEVKRYSEKYDFIRIGWGLFFVLVSLIIYSGSLMFTNSPSSEILGIYIAFYLTGVALLFDGAWPGKQDLVPLKTQYTALNGTINAMSNTISTRQTEIRNELDTLSKKIDVTSQKITQKNLCSKVRFKYRYPIIRRKPKRK